MKHINAVSAQLGVIPAERFLKKVVRSVFGMAFIAGAVLMAWKLNVPWYVYLPVAVFGAHIVSAELTRSSVVFVVAVVKDLWAIIRNKNGPA